jgi:hypothetical protein
MEFDRRIIDTLMSKPLDKCGCCGVRLNYSTGTIRDHTTPTIDRIDNTKGYIPTNVCLICWGCNSGKADLTIKDIRMFSEYIKRNTPKPVDNQLPLLD